MRTMLADWRVRTSDGCGDYDECKDKGSAPGASWDRLDTATTSFWKVVDVHDLTQAGSVTLTETYVNTWSPQPDPDGWINAGANLMVNVSNDTQLAIQQTPSAFRPYDARDPAVVGRADCRAFDPVNPVNDNCHVVYSVWFSGLKGEIILSPMGAKVSRVVRPSGATPMRVPAVARADQGNAMVLPATFRFTLSRPTAVTSWLKGTSTNYGTDSTSVPDYFFGPQVTNSNLETPSADGLSIASTDAVDLRYGATLPTVTVTSRDFGGKAVLKGIVTILGVDFAVEVMDENKDDISAPAGVCGSDFAQHPFASLPVDQDCNGIADAWEKPYVQTLLGQDHFPDPSVDTDRGAQGANTPTSLLGDGLSVHDEYRGFHVLDPVTGRMQWASTDPTRQDLFYWDADHIGRTSSDRVGTGTFSAILGSTTSAFMDIHPVDRLLSNGNRAARTNEDAGPINRNTLYPAHRAYAVIYVNRALAQGTIGQSDLEGSSWAFQNSGTPIFIDKQQIDNVVQPTTFQPGVLLAETVAHETGHKLSRKHPLRCADAPVAYDALQAPSLTINQFMQQGNNLLNLFVRYGVYSVNGIHKRERMLSTGYYIIRENSETPVPSSGVAPPDWTYKIRAATRTPRRYLYALSELPIETQESRMMDWTPDLMLTTPDRWSWSDRDANALCLQWKGCQNPFPLWPRCTFHWY